MEASIADPDPVVVLADRAILYDRTELPGDTTSPWRTRRVRTGDEVTIATTGRLVHLALEAIAKAGISAEVLDLQCLAPLDLEPILESLGRTSRLLIVHDEARCGSMAATLANEVYERAFWLLDAPVQRVTSPSTPVPAAHGLEDAYVVDVNQITMALEDVCDRRGRADR